MIALASIDPPLVAILRGLEPARAARVGEILFSAGFLLLEVPLNRPGALDAIAALKSIAPAGALIGGGTILTVKDVNDVAAAGGMLAVSPNCDPEVIHHAVNCGMISLPGFATPTEAFLAMRSGAHGLKLFPAETFAPAYVKALRSVIPAEVPIYPVGGIRPESMAPYMESGASGFGIGSQLYRAEIEDDALRAAAGSFIAAWYEIRNRSS
jgi:2-dehydro-3-deoxyphosphogalactonate aldolase